jgi:hypothetical protein
MKKLLRSISLMIAFCAIFQTQTVKAANFAAILPGNTVTTANTSSFIRIDGSKIKTKITSLPFTVEMAFKPTALTNYGGLWSDRSTGFSNIIQFANGAPNLRVDYNGVNVLSPLSAVPVLNAWNHVALIVTSTSVKLVLNGVSYSRTGMINTTLPFSGKSFIGQDSASTATLNRTVTGQFDEVRFWNTARTDAELNANKFTPLTGTETGLAAYFNFDGQNTTDGTSNGVSAVGPATLAFNNLSTDASIISNADLSGINFSQGVLGADFLAATTTYTAYVPPTSANTTVVNGTTVGFLPIVQTIDLTQVSPAVALAVTSMDGLTTKTYNVNVVKTDMNTYWSGNGIVLTNTRAYANLWGWKCSNSDNTWGLTSANRYIDILASANTCWYPTTATAWGGRALYMRWDGTGNNDLNSVYTYPVSLVAGKGYTFTYKYAWNSVATAPILTYGIATDQAGSNIIASDSAKTSVKALLLKSKSLTFYVPTTGTYYIAIKSNTASLCVIADLNIVESSSTPVLNTSTQTLSFDNFNLTRTFVVSGGSLTNDITLVPPTGITLDKTTITAADALAGVTITATYNNSTIIFGGIISVTSGLNTKSITINASNDASCFSQFYPGLTNMIADPYLNSLSTYAGWGTKSIVTDPAKAYCGLSCALIGNGTAKNTGSMDFNVTGKMLANTTYRLRAMVQTVGTGLSMEFGIGGCGVGGLTTDFNTLVTTNGVWAPVDFTFTTGTLAAAQGIYFNNSNATTPAFSGYIDNYELYAVPAIYAPASLSFLGAGSQTMVVRGVSFTDNITITAPTGYTVTPSTFVPSPTGTTVTVTFNSATSASGSISLTNAAGTVTQSLTVTGTVAPTIVANPTSLIFDDLNPNGSFTVTGGNLLSDIMITAPAGITVNPTTIPAGSANGVTVTVTYDGTTSNVSGNITLTSGATVAAVAVTAGKNSDCFTPLYPSIPNLIPNPTLNDISAFGGWGHKSVVFGQAYCGAACVKFDGIANAYLDGAALDVTNIAWAPNATYRVHAWVKAVDGTFAFLAQGTNPDVLISVPQNNQWVLIDQTFTTGAAPTTSFFTFNNLDGASTGKVAYIDNYELYNITSTVVTKNDNLADNQNLKIYIKGDKMVADFNLTEASNVEFSVYNVQGMLLSNEKEAFATGQNQKVINANFPSGVYLVKMIGNGLISTTKVIK